ncbi:MAG: hypothetical protein HRT44_09950 [Bdellovibrionales bacterium]|nr:hypothetical protein [Bdellovibrionales bacterium]
MSDLWFKRKKYGWGWTSITWQGWAVTIGYCCSVGIYIGYTYVPQREFLKVFILCLITSIPMIAIGYLKGPKPKLQWREESYD